MMGRNETLAVREAQDMSEVRDSIRYWRDVSCQYLEDKLKLEHAHAKLKHELFWWKLLAWMGVFSALLMNVAFYIAAFVAPPAHWRMFLEGLL